MTKRARILHVYKDIWPPVAGGIESHIHDVCIGLRERFHFAIMVAWDRAVSVRTNLEGIPLFKIATWGRLASAPVCPTFPFWLASLARRADIIHYHLPMPTAEVSHLLVRPAAPALVTYHSDIVRQRWALGVYGPVLRVFLRRAALILPTSPRYLETSRFLRPFRDRCRPIPLGIDTAAFARTPAIEDAASRLRAQYGHRPLIGFVGCLRAYKGLPFLIEAMTAINPEARCLIAGEGPIRRKLETLTVERGLAERVFFLGRVTEEQKVALLNAIDVFCLPSHLRSEAFGLAQVEAMACGKPVVSCDLDTGVPYVNRHCETGLIVPPASPPALAGALNELLSSHDLRRRLGAAGRRRAAAEFDRSLMLERLAAVYDELAGPTKEGE